VLVKEGLTEYLPLLKKSSKSNDSTFGFLWYADVISLRKTLYKESVSGATRQRFHFTLMIHPPRHMLAIPA
jgi:hypothetical protein